jgi:hypothetical protein
MSAVDELTDEQLERRAAEVLQRELGLAGVVRLMKLRTSSGDYTLERGGWLDRLTVDEIAAEVGIPTKHT